MFPLFGKSSKSPTEVVKALRESLNTLEKGGDPKKEEKAQEEVPFIITFIITFMISYHQ